jgi:DNA-directed RNA polymerases I, II, and III subunit RPABC1
MEVAYSICMEMFEQRGYKIIERDEEQILAFKPNGKQICAFMANTPKFNVERIQEYISIMKQIDVSHAVIVYKDNATPVAKKVIGESTDILIELFQEEELQYNITKHYLVPKHELHCVKGTKECKEFKDKYGDKYPVILKTDPVSRFYGYDKGDIIKITRQNGHVMFRFVK